MDIQRKTPASRLDSQKIGVLSEVRRMCVNYVLCCITVPDMFGWVCALQCILRGFRLIYRGETVVLSHQFAWTNGCWPIRMSTKDSPRKF